MVAAGTGASSALAQPPSIFYVYDDLNRLTAVVDPQGNAATYTYDAVGNILRIERFDTSAIAGAVGITLVSPSKGRAGTSVQIFGKGFGATTAANAISFNGTPAIVTAAAENRLVTTVPAGATTGPITVTAPRGSATSSQIFTVVGTLAIAPATATVSVKHAVQFQAQESGVSTTNVRWAVNGITGGDALIGTITTDGLYTAPATVSRITTVTVSAIHRDDASITASAPVVVLPPPPVFLISRGVSVGITASATTPALAELVTARGVSVAVAASMTAAAQTEFTAAPGVSVTIAPPAAATTLGEFAASRTVSIAREPVITSVTPSSSPAGTTVSITLTGAGLSGASSVAVFSNDAFDTNIVAQHLVVDGTGTHATVDLVIAATAPLGLRVIQIATPNGSSAPIALGGNVFTVQ